MKIDKPTSYVHFKHGGIVHATNDGMSVLGHFLLNEVGAKPIFFIKFFEDKRNESISAGPYNVQTEGDEIVIEHMEQEEFIPFTSTRDRLVPVVKQWSSLCGSDTHAICNSDGREVYMIRLADGSICFKTC